jgi:serine/threonine protein kinase
MLSPDIKPSNILLNHNGDIKLNNFGIASCLLNSIARVMDDGAVFRPYMAVSTSKLSAIVLYSSLNV